MSKTNPINIRLEVPLFQEIKNLAKVMQVSVSSLLIRLIKEALRMFVCPGIVFTNSPTGRRATVSGCGLDVWEVINIYKGYKKNKKKILEDYPLTQVQLNSALNYYANYKEEIDHEIKANQEAEDLLASGKVFTGIIKLKI